MKRNTGQGTRVAHMFRRLGAKLGLHEGVHGTWIDVGAHHGEMTLHAALQSPGLKVYAFEPNPSAAEKLTGRAWNYFVIPMAVTEHDGFADLHINAFEAASSLLPFDQAALESWVGAGVLKVDSVIKVPTVRLDTFMNGTGIQHVDYLKIDTQGMDLAVLKSAGSRLQDIAKIAVEVDITPVRLYSGAPSKEEVLAFLGGAGFSLVSVEKQTHGQEENLTFIRNDHIRRLRDREPKRVGASE